MAGTLTISTLSDGTNSTSTTNCIRGSAKAWVNFNGSTAAIRASYNVGSVTRNSTGDYTINFTTALSNANYAVATGGCYTDNTTAERNFLVVTETFTTTSFRVFGTDPTSGTALDYAIISCTVFGN